MGRAHCELKFRFNTNRYKIKSGSIVIKEEMGTLLQQAIKPPNFAYRMINFKVVTDYVVCCI